MLLIEDDPRDTRAVEHALRQRSPPAPMMHQVETVEEGVDRLRGGGIDAVLLDLDLSDPPGLEGLAALQVAAPEVPVVVLTGIQGEGTGELALRAGAQDFLVKGSLFSKLVDRSVRYAIERHRILTGLRRKTS